MTTVASARSLAEALRIKDGSPGAVPIQGGTDLLVELNFDRTRPDTILDLGSVDALSGWSIEDGMLGLGAAVTFTALERPPLSDLMPALAEASRTVGSPQIRNRGTLGGNLGTASPAGDAIPPLLAGRASVRVASVDGERELPLAEFLTGPRQNALRANELISGIRLEQARGPQTFMKVGPRMAMAIAVVSIALVVDAERDEVRVALGSAGPTVRLVTASLAERDSLPDRVAEASSPIDDVRGRAAYRRHALGVMTRRALERCLA